MAGAKRGLGRGLGALFGDDTVEEVIAEEKAEKAAERKTQRAAIKTKTEKNGKKISRKAEKIEQMGVENAVESQMTSNPGFSESKKTQEEELIQTELEVKVSEIEPNRDQPRKVFDEAQLQELADSVQKYGVLQPLLVQKKGESYEIIAGERRWRAAKLAGFREVPVIVREYTRQQTMEIALIENVQRADLNPIEEAKAYQMLIQEFGLRQEDVAERVAKNRATITNSMRLLKLDERVQEMLIQDRLTGGHARALLSLEDGEKQYQLALKTVENHLSVREVERLVKELLKPKKAKKKADPERDMEVFFKDVEEKLKGVMGTKVSINRKDKNKGRIEIEYYSSAELERLIELLESLRQ